MSTGFRMVLSRPFDATRSLTTAQKRWKVAHVWSKVREVFRSEGLELTDADDKVLYLYVRLMICGDKLPEAVFWYVAGIAAGYIMFGYRS